MKRPLVVAILVAATAAVAILLSLNKAPETMDDPSKRPPRVLKIAPGQSVRDFMSTNALPADSAGTSQPDVNNYSVALDTIADTGPIVFGNHWISLSVEGTAAALTVPAGRTLFIDQEAGRIKSFSFTPGDQALPLASLNPPLKKMLDGFLEGGWRPEVANSVRLALTDQDEDLQRSGEKIVAQLQDTAGNLLNLTVTNIASVPSQPSYLFGAARQRPAGNPPVYVVRVGIYWAKRNDTSYGDLVYPRRLFVNGNKDQALRLRAWVEDPDWTPAKHGMVDQGGRGEARSWYLPPR